jgi:MFS family permease
MRPPLTVWVTWLVLMAGANLATPLYALYASRFHFSSLVLTTVFATYAVVLVPALILFGRLSDQFGRRPVILAGLGVAGLGLALFAAADGTAWLYGARAVQGLAVGMIGGPATAALVELDPDGDRRRAALFAGLAQAGGSATGPLVAGVLAQWAPDPLRLCYLVGIGATVAVAAATLTLPAAGGGGERWRPQWPHVPREIRGGFARVSLTAAVAWASVALYLSIVPSYAAQLSTTHDVALLAAIAALALLSSCVAQVVAPRHTQGAGLVVLGVGLLGLVLAAPAHSLVVLVVGSVLAGAGHGAAFLDAQQDMNEIAPEGSRGEITSAFIAAIYAAVACAVVGTGLLDLVFSLQTAVVAVASALLVLSAAAAALAFGAWPRARASGSWPRSQRSRQERRPSRSRRSASTARPARSR